jgi:glycosyltransferase involved in cell wall biosynthesis
MGLERLLEAAGQLRNEQRGFRLIIGGAGSLRESLEKEVHRLGFQKDVFLVGRVPDERLAECFAAADCFILPSLALECFGLIILEAYACGTPVLGTPVGAIPELISDERREWLTDGTSSYDIAARMREFLDGRLAADPQRLQAFAEQFNLQKGTARLAATCLDGIEIARQ